MIDFKGIRENVPIDKAAVFAGIELKKEKDYYRCFCPACDKDRVLIITPAKSVFYCHNNKKGGDVTDLVAHVRGITQSEAAKLLQSQFMREPEKPSPKAGAKRKAAPKKRQKVGQVPVGGTETPGGEMTEWEFMEQFA